MSDDSHCRRRSLCASRSFASKKTTKQPFRLEILQYGCGRFPPTDFITLNRRFRSQNFSCSLSKSRFLDMLADIRARFLIVVLPCYLSKSFRLSSVRKGSRNLNGLRPVMRRGTASHIEQLRGGKKTLAVLVSPKNIHNISMIDSKEQSIFKASSTFDSRVASRKT